VTTNYVLDLNAGLTQVLSDGTSQYLYGLGRVGEYVGGQWAYYATDALGSVRQIVDANGQVVFYQSYEPYGKVLVSSGTAESNYGYAGEWTDAYIKLIYLRSRYYAPTTGRFLTKDVWQGDYTRPLSLNRWIYVEGNPVNYIDPSGMMPCNLDSRYCLITEGTYNGFFIDTDHFQNSFNKSREIILALLNEAKGNDGYLLKINNPLSGFIPFSGNFITHIPPDAGSLLINQIGLGIFLEFNYELESYEGVWPGCWLYSNLGEGRCSAFANEDLPSDYLGFVSYLIGEKDPAGALNEILSRLEGDEGRSEGIMDVPDQYGETLEQARSCWLEGLCGEDSPFNQCALPKIYDAISNTYTYKQWPSDLIVDPIGSGEYWEVLYYNTIYGPVGPYIPTTPIIPNW
jgi:RHS repeat-associated protein